MSDLAPVRNGRVQHGAVGAQQLHPLLVITEHPADHVLLEQVPHAAAIQRLVEGEAKVPVNRLEDGALGVEDELLDGGHQLHRVGEVEALSAGGKRVLRRRVVVDKISDLVDLGCRNGLHPLGLQGHPLVR